MTLMAVLGSLIEFPDWGGQGAEAWPSNHIRCGSACLGCRVSLAPGQEDEGPWPISVDFLTRATVARLEAAWSTVAHDRSTVTFIATGR